MKKALVLVALLAVVSAAQAGFIVENRSGGQNYSQWSITGGWATSSGNVNAPGCTANIGSMYSSAGTYFGPTRQGIFSFTPSETGLYDIELAWPSTAGQTDTAVVLYTGVSSGGETDPWGNAGPGGVVSRTTMDMNYKNVGVWNMAFDDVTLTAGTTYMVGIYAGHKSTDTTNRVAAGAAQFTAVPEPVTLAMLAFGGLFLRRRRA
jgi:hypothetical protein